MMNVLLLTPYFSAGPYRNIQSRETMISKKYIILVFVWMLCTSLVFGQLNMLMPLDTFPGASISDLRVEGDAIYTSLIYRETDDIRASAILKISQTDHLVNKVVEYHNFSGSYRGISTCGDLNLYGMNRKDSDILQVYNLHNDLEISSIDSLIMPQGVVFPVNGLYSEEKHMLAFITDYDNPDIRTYTIAIRDAAGQYSLREFNRDMRYSYLDDMDWYQDSDILLSSAYSWPNRYGRFCQLHRTDSDGNIIWTYNGDDMLDNGAVACLIAPLSNGEIVQIYEVRGDQYPHWRMIWLSQEGELVRDSTIDVVDYDKLIYIDLVPGLGDYFFAYGDYIFGDDPRNLDWHGLITKFDNKGNVIWSRMYQHEELVYKPNLHWLTDIYEKEDGSLIVLGTATTRFLEEKYMWLFEVDSNGCFDPLHCDDRQIITDVSEVLYADNNHLKVYPNPARDEIHIDFNDEGKHVAQVNIYAMDGMLALHRFVDINSYNTTIDISHLSIGVYSVQVVTKTGDRYTQRLLIHW